MPQGAREGAATRVALRRVCSQEIWLALAFALGTVLTTVNAASVPVLQVRLCVCEACVGGVPEAGVRCHPPPS